MAPPRCNTPPVRRITAVGAKRAPGSASGNGVCASIRRLPRHFAALPALQQSFTVRFLSRPLERVNRAASLPMPSSLLISTTSIRHRQTNHLYRQTCIAPARRVLSRGRKATLLILKHDISPHDLYRDLCLPRIHVNLGKRLTVVSGGWIKMLSAATPQPSTPTSYTSSTTSTMALPCYLNGYAPPVIVEGQPGHVPGFHSIYVLYLGTKNSLRLKTSKFSMSQGRLSNARW